MMLLLKALWSGATSWATPLRLIGLAAAAAVIGTLWWEYTRQLDKIADQATEIANQAALIKGYEVHAEESARAIEHLRASQRAREIAAQILARETAKKEAEFDAIRRSLKALPGDDLPVGPAVNHVFDSLRPQQTAPRGR
ncbi:MAG: hypothetical protein Alpg2KO_00660 [Alphaproteobacteria bacterium]